jgi:UDP-GlcNAc:undecaprenyl-phosphate/decaprenyl-phosphate GlcNAc-1-phosphate transferase
MNELLLKMGAAALIAGGVAIGTVPLIKRLAEKYGAVRAPRERDVHSKAMPLWGGIAMFLGFMAAVLIVRLWTGQEMAVAVGKGQHPVLGILLGASLIAVIGMLDDKYDLPPKVQAAALLTAGFVAAVLGARVEGLTNPLAAQAVGGYTSENWLKLPLYVSVPATMLWVFLVAKTVDFLDGMDGLAAGVCTIAALAMGMMAAARGDVAVAYMSAALVGACLGFLRHNYNPASIFMGTVGAQFLGFILAMLAVVGTLKIQAAISIVVALLVLGVPVFDGLYVVARRLYLRKGPTVADKTHIHHRLQQRGLSVRQVVWAVYAITASCCLLAVLLAWNLAR